ncbi:MAG: nucleotide exchange factor GrpE [Actinobacteria bacterium]|nr:nucleotide exchange factor GrpE [Actinomycetota bacterium]
MTPEELQPGDGLPGDEAAGREEAADTPAAPPPDLPDDPAEAVPVLIEALMESRAALESRTDDLQRVAAEFDNFRKRSARERDDLVARATQRLVEALLPVLDSFDGALAHEAGTPGEEAMLGGMQGTYQQLMTVLAAEGLAVVPSVGEPFDPAVHEAVMGGGDGHLVVTAEMRRGYTLGGRVIRPAMVQVADEDEA